MAYLGIDPQLRAYRTAVYIAREGENILPLVLDAEYLLVKNGVILTPKLDYDKSNENKVALFEPATAGDEFYLMNLSTFTFTGMVTEQQLEEKLNEFANPLFSVVWFPSRESITFGHIPADGQLELRDMYPDVLLGIQQRKVPVVAEADWNTGNRRASYTLGDGSTNFRVPDYNGKSTGGRSLFLRGDGTGADSAGIVQGDAIKSHTTQWWWATKRSNEQSYTSIPHVGVNNVAIPIPNLEQDVDDYNPANASTYSGGVSKSATQIQTVYQGETETRTVNTAGVWCIRVAHRVQHSGVVTAKGVVEKVEQNTVRISEVETKTDVQTINLPLINGWNYYESGYQIPKAHKIGNVVRLQGLIRNASPVSSSNNIVATLPVGWRPKNTVLTMGFCSPQVVWRIDVTGGGSINVAVGAPVGTNPNNWISLENVSFVVEE